MQEQTEAVTFGKWELRTHLEGNSSKSHYEGSYVSEAMQLVASLRQPIQSAIFDYCDDLKKYFVSKSGDGLPPGMWGNVLARHLLVHFVNAHIDTGKFSLDQIKDHYPYPYTFFSDISFLSSDKEYQDRLKKISKNPIVKDDIKPGWAAMIREFGIFSTGLGGESNINNMCLEILKCQQNIPLLKNGVQQTIDKHLPQKLFINEYNNNIKCPARNLMRDYFGLCVALNTALITINLYSNACRISLIKENGHFKKQEDMLAEYEEKIKSL
jgi:hypothetical protein